MVGNPRSGSPCLLRAAAARVARNPRPPLARARPLALTTSFNRLPLWEDSRPMGRYVYDFDEPASGGKQLLGGKGAGLAEMRQLGIPVPAGFTITTDACRGSMAAGKQLLTGREHELPEPLEARRGHAGQRLRPAADR